MSALRDLLAIEDALGRKSGEGAFVKYLMKQMSKAEKKSAEDKKKEDEKKKKGWTIEDRICLGLLMAFAAVPLGAMYLYMIRTMMR